VPAKATGGPTDVETVDRWGGGVGWQAHPGEVVRQTSHALATGEGVWLVDPLDGPGVEDLIAEYGDVAGIVLLSNSHRRDAAAFARRHDVSVTVPEPVADVVDVDATVETVPVGTTLGGYDLLEVASTSALGADWYEYALFDGEMLVVGESVGRAPLLPRRRRAARRDDPPAAVAAAGRARRAGAGARALGARSRRPRRRSAGARGRARTLPVPVPPRSWRTGSTRSGPPSRHFTREIVARIRVVNRRRLVLPRLGGRRHR